MAETDPGQPTYAEQAHLFSSDVTRRPIFDHLLKAKKLEQVRLGFIKKNGRRRTATLSDAERSLHSWWYSFTDGVLSKTTDSDLNQPPLDRIEGLLTDSKDANELLEALVLVLPRKAMLVQNLERRLDLAERLANRVAEIAPSSMSHYAQHKAQRARENATGKHSVQTTGEGKIEILREMGENLGVRPKPRPLKHGIA